MDPLEVSRRYSATTTQLFEDFIVLGGSGSSLFGQLGDAKPRWYLDFAASIGVAGLGHNPPEVTQAVVSQLSAGIAAVDGDWPIREAALLKERLAQLCPGDFPKKVFLCDSGALAVNAAVKIGFDARPGRPLLLGFQGAFHGRVGYALDLTDSRPVQKEGFPAGAEVLRLPFPDKDSPGYAFRGWQKIVKQRFSVWGEPDVGRISSFVFELVQGEGGIRVADPKAVDYLIEYLRDRNILIVVDEVQTGIGRTGKFLASEHYGIAPDMVCLSKSLGGGIPIGAVVFRADLDFTRKGRHSSTFGGNSLASAAALAVVGAVSDRNFLGNIDLLSKVLTDDLWAATMEIQFRCPSVLATTSGLGLMRKIDLRDRNGEPIPDLQEKIERRCLENGLIVVHAGKSAIRFLPPLVITAQEIRSGVATFTRSVLEVLA